MTVVENIRSFLETRNGEGLDLTGAYLTEANLSSAHLEGANLSGAHLEGANLSGAHLEGANLSGANLFFTNLTNADLSGANLVNAKLVGANLKEANLVNANLKGTDLTGANVSGANFINAYGITGDTLRAYGVENLDIAKNVPEVLREPPSSDSLEGVPEGVPEGVARPLSSLSQEIQNISYFTLTNKLKSKKDKILININEEVVGQMMGEDLMLEENTVIIKEYINEDKDNIVIAYEIETGIKKGKNGYFFTTRSIITQNYLDLTGKPEDEQKEIIEEAEYREFYEKKSLVFPCKKADKTHIAREENVIKYAYFDLTRLGFINAPQKYCDMQKYDLNRNNQLFAIVPLVNEKGEQVEYPTFVGLENYVDHNEDLTGALHCQAGQENKVCRLIVGTPICGDAKSIVKGPSEGGRKKKTIKKNKSLTKTGKKKKTIKKTGKKKKNK